MLPLGGLVTLLSLFMLLAVGAPRGKEPTAMMTTAATAAAVREESEHETDQMDDQQHLAAPLLRESDEPISTADAEAAARLLLLAREEAATAPSVRDVSTGVMLQHADCWLLAGAFGIGTGVGLMTINNAAQIAAARGHGHAATLTTLLGVTNAVGRCESNAWVWGSGDVLGAAEGEALPASCWEPWREMHSAWLTAPSAPILAPTAPIYPLHLRDPTLFRPPHQMWTGRVLTTESGDGGKSRRLAAGVLSDRYRQHVPRPLALAGALVLMGFSQVALEAAWLQVDHLPPPRARMVGWRCRAC